jgi:hypothetical protein
MKRTALWLIAGLLMVGTNQVEAVFGEEPIPESAWIVPGLF